MGRRVRGFLTIIPAAAVVVLSLLLVTCSNDFDIFEAIKTEMKIANDLFLEITDSSPPKNEEEVSQLERIEIEFDRSIDTNTVDQSSILFDPAPGTGDMLDWSFIYNDTTKTLYIYPDPVLDPNEPYTVTVNSNLKGKDGSDLQDPYSWAFETKESATGNFFIESTSDQEGLNEATIDDYTKSTSVDLRIYGMNPTTGKYLFGETENAVVTTNLFLWQTRGGVAPAEWYTASAPATTVALSGSDGIKTVYMGFSDGAETPTANQLKADTIILDRLPPNVTITTKTININTSRIDAYVTEDLSVTKDVSGIASYSWTAPPEITLSSSTVEDPSIQSRASEPGKYVAFSLKVTDGAENFDTASKSIWMDTVRPDPPDVQAKEVDGAGRFGPVDFDRDFYWYWETGGSEDAIKVYQFYQPETDYFVGKTEKTEFKTELKEYGPYSLDVRQFDDDQNLSTTKTLTIYFSPRGDVLYPVWGQDMGELRDTYLEWPDYKGEVEKPYYDIYMRADGDPGEFQLLDQDTATDLRESFWPNKVLEFKPGVFYEWYVAVKKEPKDSGPVDYMPRRPEEGPVYCFTPQ